MTIGLHSAHPERDDGIYWSLPLAHLRFYGDPVMRTASAGNQSSRVSIDQLLLVTLGSVMGTWGKFGSDIAEPIEIINKLLHDMGYGVAQGPRWVQPIALPVRKFLESPGEEREANSRLVQFGIRRCPEFIARPHNQPAAMFGLADMRFLISQCPDMPSQLQCLRSAAAAFKVANVKDAFIRYYTDDLPRYTLLNSEASLRTKRTRSGAAKQCVPELESHGHWMHDDKTCPYDHLNDNPHNQELEECTQRAGHFELSRSCPSNPGKERIMCEFVYGDPSKAAVFRPRKSTLFAEPTSNRVELKEIAKIHPFRVHPRLMSRHLGESCSDIMGKSKCGDYFDSLTSIRDSLDIYARLPSATIDMKVTSRPMHSWAWSKSSREKMGVSLADAFACIAVYETGDLDINPYDLHKAAIMAMYYDNSMYVAERMISDPADMLP